MSQNKKDCNDVNAALFSVFFCCWQLKKGHRKLWFIKVLLISWHCSGNKPFNFSYLDISHKLLTNYAVHTIFHTQPSSPMLVLTPFVPRDSFIKADAQQIQLMYFPATYPPTTYLATYVHYYSQCGKHFFFQIYFISVEFW